MWNWLSGIIDKLTSIAKSIAELPGKIVDGIINGLKELFIPNSTVLNSIWQSGIDQIAVHFDFIKYDLSSLFSDEKQIEDVEEIYTIYGLGDIKLKFLDTTFLHQGIEFFRPIIRGFTMLMLVLFNIRQFFAFFHLDSGISPGKVSHSLNTFENKGGKK